MGFKINIYGDDEDEDDDNDDDEDDDEDNDDEGVRIDLSLTIFSRKILNRLYPKNKMCE